VHQVWRQTEIPTSGYRPRRVSGPAHFRIFGVAYLENRCTWVSRAEGPRHGQGSGEFVVVVRRAIVTVAMKRHLDGVRVTVAINIVAVFMEGEGENRRAAEGPQQ
jgi:hypothetical protein